MAKKTIRVSDQSAQEIPDGKGAIVRIVFADQRKGVRELDLTDQEAEKLGGRQVARRGRRSKQASQRATFEEAKALIAGLLRSGEWVSSNEIHAKLRHRLSDPMFGRVKKDLRIENRRARGPNGKMRVEWRLPKKG